MNDDQFRLPNIGLQESTSQYFHSKKYTKEIKIKNVEIFNKDNIMEIFINYKERLDKLGLDLKKSRARFVEESENRDQEKKELEKLAQGFRNDFIFFNEFVKRNKQKQIRTAKNIKELNVINNLRDIENENMKEKLLKIKRVIKMLKPKVREFSIYQNFLNQAKEAYPKDFKSIEDFPYQYLILLNANESLMNKHTKNFKTLQDAHAKFSEITTESLSKILGLTVKRMDLCRRYEEAMKKTLLLEGNITNIWEKIAEIFYENCSVQLACNQIYKHICTRKKVTLDLEPNEYENKFIHIKDQLYILQILTQNNPLLFKDRNISSN